MLTRIAVTVVLIATLGCMVEGYYFPGYPKVHPMGGPVKVYVNTLRSPLTLTPYEFYHIPSCQPAVIRTRTDVLGEALFGDQMQNTPYNLRMGQNESCVLLQCRPQDQILVHQYINVLEQFIKYEYRAGISIDNLAAYTDTPYNCNVKNPPERWLRNRPKRGYALGTPEVCTGDGNFINNHLHFNIKYHPQEYNRSEATVVGLSVVPYSIDHERIDSKGNNCNSAFDITSDAPGLTTSAVRNGTKVYWSYSVTWFPSDRTWATRWDEYLHTSIADTNDQVHWIMIIDGLLIAMCIAFLAGMILMRTLHKDFNRYNSEDPDERQNEMGWKLVHADVFRTPSHNAMLSILVGTGVQVVLLCIFMLIFSLMGFLAPNHRGALLMTLILLFVLLSFIQGYVVARLLIFFENKQWKSVFGGALFFPGTLFAIWTFIDIIEWHLDAADAVDLTTYLTLFGFLFGVTVPLSILGASFGFRQPRIDVKIKVGRLAREIPAQRWYHSPPATYLIPPIVPMAILLMELKFILSSIWQGVVYFVFGFLALVFVVWMVTVVMTTIILLYYQLTFEDYRWWWRSLIMPGGMGLHFFGYAVYWYMTQLTIKTTLGTIIYFCYMGAISLAYGMAAGALGFIAGFIFVSKIYSSIKLE